MQKAEMERGVPKSFRSGLGIAAGFLVVGLLVKKLGIGMSQKAHQLAGGVTVRGGIMGIQTAGMAADLNKQPGSTIRVDVGVTVVAVDSQGDRLAWPYRIQAFLLDGRVNPPITLSTECDPIGCSVFRQLSTGNQTFHINLPVPANTAPGTYVVNVNLSAAKSDAQGNPTTARQFLDGRDATDKIIVGGGPTSVGGSIGDITLSQQARMGRR